MASTTTTVATSSRRGRIARDPSERILPSATATRTATCSTSYRNKNPPPAIRRGRIAKDPSERQLPAPAVTAARTSAHDRKPRVDTVASVASSVASSNRDGSSSSNASSSSSNHHWRNETENETENNTDNGKSFRESALNDIDDDNDYEEDYYNDEKDYYYNEEEEEGKRGRAPPTTNATATATTSSCLKKSKYTRQTSSFDNESVTTEITDGTTTDTDRSRHNRLSWNCNVKTFRSSAETTQVEEEVFYERDFLMNDDDEEDDEEDDYNVVDDNVVVDEVDNVDNVVEVDTNNTKVNKPWARNRRISMIALKDGENSMRLDEFMENDDQGQVGDGDNNGSHTTTMEECVHDVSGTFDYFEDDDDKEKVKNMETLRRQQQQQQPRRQQRLRSSLERMGGLFGSLRSLLKDEEETEEQQQQDIAKSTSLLLPKRDILKKRGSLTNMMIHISKSVSRNKFRSDMNEYKIEDIDDDDEHNTNGNDDPIRDTVRQDCNIPSEEMTATKNSSSSSSGTKNDSDKSRKNINNNMSSPTPSETRKKPSSRRNPSSLTSSTNKEKALRSSMTLFDAIATAKRGKSKMTQLRQSTDIATTVSVSESERSGGDIVRPSSRLTMSLPPSIGGGFGGESFYGSFNSDGEASNLRKSDGAMKMNFEVSDMTLLEDDGDDSTCKKSTMDYNKFGKHMNTISSILYAD